VSVPGAHPRSVSPKRIPAAYPLSVSPERTDSPERDRRIPLCVSVLEIGTVHTPCRQLYLQSSRASG
jgi:hypothetical protein